MIIAKFQKLGVFSYLSFLDIRHAFVRTLNRAKITLKMSQGFNPHELVFFNDPDALGISSNADYVMLDTDCEPSNLIEAFNQNAPDGIKMLNCEYLQEKIVFNMFFKYAQYDFVCKKTIDKQKLQGILSQNEFIVSKKNKDGENKILDIKSSIKEILVIDNNKIQATLTYGQTKINPFLLLDYLCNILELNRQDFEVIKNTVFTINDKNLSMVDTIFFKNSH